MYRSFGILAAVAFLSGLAGQVKASTLTPSSTDLWDISQGATVTGNTPTDGGTSIENMFGGTNTNLSFPWEHKNTIFADFQPAGTVDWVEWQNAQPVTIKSFALFACEDIHPSQI